MNEKISSILSIGIISIMIFISFSILVSQTVKAIQTPIILTPEPTNPNRTPQGTWDGGYLMEQSDFRIQNGTFIGWYRGNVGSLGNSHIGYETSIDGITWNRYVGNPILLDNWACPYVVEEKGYYYMFVKKIVDNNIYMFNLTTNHIIPQIMNAGKPVLYHSLDPDDWTYEIFNVAVEIVGSDWYMMIESRSAGQPFVLGYSHSEYSKLNWTENLSPTAILATGDAFGNPDLRYIPEHNSLLLLYGFYVDSKWEVRAGYANLSDNLNSPSSWKLIPANIFRIYNDNFHIADSSMLFPFNSTSIIISYSWDQTSISQSYYDGTLLEFYEQLTGFTYYPPIIDNTPEQYHFVVIIMILIATISIGLIWYYGFQREKLTLIEFIEMIISVVIGLMILGIVIPLIG